MTRLELTRVDGNIPNEISMQKPKATNKELASQEGQTPPFRIIRGGENSCLGVKKLA